MTDKDGKFQFRGFSPYEPVYVSGWSDTETANDDIFPTFDHPDTESITRIVDLQLSRGTTFTGRVVQNGTPVPGVTIKLMKAPPERISIRFRLVDETITETDGRYTLAGLHKGERYEVDINAPGNAEVQGWKYQSPSINTNNNDDGATIELPDAVLVTNGQELRGLVVDPDDNPVSGITVVAELASGGNLSELWSARILRNARYNPALNARYNPPSTETNEKGEFHLTNLPEEPISLMAYRANPAGGRIHYSSNLTADLNATDIRIVLDPKLSSNIEDLDAK